VSRSSPPFRQRLAAAGIDGVTLLVLPAIGLLAILFIYPFAYGLVLSFRPKDGSIFSNYSRFFSDRFLYGTISTTLWIALPVTLVNLLAALPAAFRIRQLTSQRLITTILVLPITLGTVLVAEGMLNFYGPQGWFIRILTVTGLGSAQSIKLIHNYWGVFLSLLITGFPFTFLLTLSYVSGIDVALEKAAATLGAHAAARFRLIYLPLLMPGLAITFCLSFVQAYSVFPSAVLLGAPAGPTRVISMAAYEAAFEQYDYSLASAIAMIMALVQLIVVVGILSLRSFFYRGPAAGAKG
jgi:putative spermidine/putrescine transport system permease protein